MSNGTVFQLKFYCHFLYSLYIACKYWNKMMFFQDQNHLNGWSASVTDYFNYYMMWSSSRPIPHFEHTPYLTAEVCTLLKTRHAAFRFGDKAGFGTARANLSWAFRKMKQNYTERIHGHSLYIKDTWGIWQGIQGITEYKATPHGCDCEWFICTIARFRPQNNMSAGKSTPKYFVYSVVQFTFCELLFCTYCSVYFLYFCTALITHFI